MALGAVTRPNRSPACLTSSVSAPQTADACLREGRGKSTMSSQGGPESTDGQTRLLPDQLVPQCGLQPQPQPAAILPRCHGRHGLVQPGVVVPVCSPCLKEEKESLTLQRGRHPSCRRQNQPSTVQRQAATCQTSNGPLVLREQQGRSSTKKSALPFSHHLGSAAGSGSRWCFGGGMWEEGHLRDCPPAF